MLSGPIDIDKMDYLARDSLHAGVPYGRHFDQERLMGSLCLNEAGDGLAITDKGKTAAEMMVFARYVMFSEVYWHHAVRSATAMLQRAFYLLHGDLDLDALFRLTEAALIAALDRGRRAGPGRRTARRSVRADAAALQAAWPNTASSSSAICTSGWRVGRIRGWWPAPSISRRWPARRWAGSWPRTKSCSTPRRSAAKWNSTSRSTSPKSGHYRTLGEVSPVIRALAREQFDDYVKRVRIFAHARVAEQLRELTNPIGAGRTGHRAHGYRCQVPFSASQKVPDTFSAVLVGGFSIAARVALLLRRSR